MRANAVIQHIGRASLLALTCLLSAPLYAQSTESPISVNAAATEAAAVDKARLPYASWEDFLARADFDRVMSTYSVLSDAGPALEAERCRELVPMLAQARAENPYSPALQLLQSACAKQSQADQHSNFQQEGQDLRDFLMRDGRGSSAQLPILVPTEADAAALIESLGYAPLYGRYMVGTASGGLPFVAIFYDEKAQRERQLYFDFLRVWQSLQRDAGGSQYPAYLSGLSERYLEGAAASGNAAAELAVTTLALGRKEIELPAAIAELERLALGGSAPAVFELLPLCLVSQAVETCANTALDLVRPLAERGFAEGMVVMALAAERGIDRLAVRGDRERWLKRASERAGVGVALTAYAQLSTSLSDAKTIDPHIRDAVREAARADHAPAQLLLAQWLRDKRFKPLRGESAPKWMRRAVQLEHGPALAQLGLDELRAGRFDLAWEHLERAARREEPSALGVMALAYESGRVGREANQLDALRMYRRAALAGNAGAMRRLGGAYLRGELGLPKRIRRAEAWLLSAALFGNSRAAVELAELYLSGTSGVDGRAEEGYAVIQKLAADGMVPARVRMATALLLGQGVPKDSKLALDLLQKMEDQGIGASSFRLGQIHQFGQGGLPVDAARARSHYEKGAGLGDVESIDQYARALYVGRGGERDRLRAIDWWQRAAAKGSDEAINNLAWVRCSSRDKSIRDAQKGARQLNKLLAQKRSANIEDTFAACLAANGQYDQAVATQRSAIAKAEKDPALGAEQRAGFVARLASYERGEPWFEE